MWFKSLILIFCQFILSNQIGAQIFPNESGQILIDHLVTDYKPNFVLDYNTARDTLYANITNKQDTVYCVYSGFARFLPDFEDPTTFLFDNSSVNSINCEHTYPRSKGADAGNGLSDMHHLFPSREDVNADRGNLPFAEIPDNQTTRWYFNGQISTQIPTINKDKYSEIKSDVFEPREDHKGNVARAMMYFFTMYNPEAMAADPDYFIEQKQTLCNWHYLDPADADEVARTNQIAQYQDGKPNPFVLDCTLAARTYCQNNVGFCASATRDLSKKLPEIRCFPNPTNQYFLIDLDDFYAEFELEINNLAGQTIVLQKYKFGEMIDLGSFPMGIYFVNLSNWQSQFVGKIVKN